jgi:alkylation response protein AidB-like acyl-CoA dehydrogenase
MSDNDDPGLSPEHKMFRETCHKFYLREVEPHYISWEAAGKGTPPELWEKAAGAGIVGMGVPEEYGGPGGDLLFNLIQTEELGRFVGGASVGAAINTDIMTHVLAKYGSHEQKQRWCPGILTGQWRQAMGLTESGAGSDLSTLATRARKDGDDYVINGSKCYMSSGAEANLLYIVARTDRDVEGSKNDMTMFVVEADTPGIELRRMPTMGMRAAGVGECFLQDVRVPASHILGEEGQALRQNLMSTFAYDRAIISVRALAVAELAFDLTLDYVKTRKVGQQRVIDFQNTQMRLGEMKADLIAGQAFRQKLMREVTQGKLDIVVAASAKLWFSEMEIRVVDTCLQLHGGYGYMEESPISRLYTFSRVDTLYGGTSEIQKLMIARQLL